MKVVFFGKRHDIGENRLVAAFGGRALAGLVGPEIVFGLAGDIARILESRRATFHQAADMVAMQVGQRHHRDVVGRIAGSLQAIAKLAHAALRGRPHRSRYRRG